MRRFTRCVRPLAGAALTLAAVLAACTDRALPTAARPGAARANAAPLGVPRVVFSELAPDRCLDVEGESTAPGARLTIYNCHRRAAQQFTFEPTGEIKVYGTLCLDASPGAGNNGDPVITWTCHGGANQRWELRANGEIRGVNGKCLDVSGVRSEPGTPIVIWDCLNGANQKWTLRSADVAVADVVGSAELPRAYLNTAMPAVTGRSIYVAAGGSLQDSLNAAQPGDELVLQAGATFEGNFVLPPKPAIGPGQWIVVRSGGALPPAGSRVAPSDAPQLARLVTPNVLAPLRAAPAAEGWRVVGLELTARADVNVVQAMVEFGSGDTDQNTVGLLPRRLVLDRSYVHGRFTLDLRRCVRLDGISSAVIDSYLADCHSNAGDSQAIAGYNGPGPFKIVNNRLEGGHQGINFGGADPTVQDVIPSDIEIRRNHVIRPLSWRGPWQAKNLLELKVGQRVLIEANVFENNWSEGQAFPFIWWSVNQDGRCTWCTTTDVTFRYNRVRNVANGFNLAATGGRPVPPLRRVTIAHNVLTGENNGPLGRAYQIEGPLVGLTIANNTQIGGYNVIVASGIEGQTMPDFVFRNNVTGADTYPFASPQANGPALFTYLRVPAANVAGNVISADQAGPGGVPPGNAYAASSAAIGFVNLAGGDLRLAPTSPFRDRGVGDSRPGAEIEAIDAMTQGVVR